MLVAIGGISYHIFFFWGLTHTNPTNAAIIVALNPFFTAFGEIIFFKIRRSTRFYIGFLIAFSGALWVNITRGGHIDLSNLGLGELLCLIASLLWSTFTLTAKATKKEGWDSLWLNAYNYLLTALLILPFAGQMFTAEFWGSISTPAWLGIWYMVIFPTTIGYTMFYIGVQRKGPAWASTFIYLVPSITANLDYLFFNALFTVPLVIGTTMVVIGLLYGNIGEKQIIWLRSKLISSKL
ncbi:MAG: DMT family transporter [Calditrichaceae bacterium]